MVPDLSRHLSYYTAPYSRRLPRRPWFANVLTMCGHNRTPRVAVTCSMKCCTATPWTSEQTITCHMVALTIYECFKYFFLSYAIHCRQLYIYLVLKMHSSFKETPFSWTPSFLSPRIGTVKIHKYFTYLRKNIDKHDQPNHYIAL